MLDSLMATKLIQAKQYSVILVYPSVGHNCLHHDNNRSKAGADSYNSAAQSLGFVQLSHSLNVNKMNLWSVWGY